MSELKAAAIKNGEHTQCYICERYFASIHWHHTVPRSLGGSAELQIPLCGSCHTALHAKASAVFAILRGTGKKKVVGSYWANVSDEQRAERWLRVLVGAMLYPPVEREDKTTVLPALTVDPYRRYVLEVIKQDANLKSISQALLFCIDFTASSKGLNNNEKENKTRKSWNNRKLW